MRSPRIELGAHRSWSSIPYEGMGLATMDFTIKPQTLDVSCLLIEGYELFLIMFDVLFGEGSSSYHEGVRRRTFHLPVGKYERDPENSKPSNNKHSTM